MKKFIGAVAVIAVAVLVGQYVRHEGVDQSSPGAGRRIISLAPNLTEILFELGLGNEIVGVTTYCTYPPAARQKEKIGDFINPNTEKIVSLDPDLVIAEQWPSSKVVPRLKQMGVPVVETVSPKSLTEIYRLIDEVGRIVGRPDQASALVNSMKDRIREIEDQGKRFSRRPTLYVEIDPPSWTVGRKSFIHEAVELCGTRNIFGDVDRPAIQVSKEIIIERDPEMILSFEAGAAEIRRRPGWNQITAVREGHIIDDVDRNLLSHGNHRLVAGMEELQKRIIKFRKAPN